MFVQQLLLALKFIPHGKYEKNLLIMLVSFFTTLGLAWPKFCPKTIPTLVFSPGSQWNMLGDSISFNKFNWNLVFLKKKVKPLKVWIFGPSLHKKGFSMGHPKKGKTVLFTETTKEDQKLSKSFYFIKISYVLTKFYFVWVFFLLKSVISTHNSCAHLRTKWLWVWIPLPLLKESSDNKNVNIMIIKY